MSFWHEIAKGVEQEDRVAREALRENIVAVAQVLRWMASIYGIADDGELINWLRHQLPWVWPISTPAHNEVVDELRRIMSKLERGPKVPGS
jgi:hypothetical protein